MKKESNAILVDLHPTVHQNSFLENVKSLRKSLDVYLTNDVENPDLLNDLKLSLKRVLDQHQKIINRPIKLLPDEIKAEAMLKEMMGRGTETKKQGIMSALFEPLVKIFKGRESNYCDQIFSQILANAKFNIPVIDRAKEVERTGRKSLIEPEEGPKKNPDGVAR